MAVWRRPGLLRQRYPGVLSGVMVRLRVLARTGRVDCWCPCAGFLPSSGPNAMSILCEAHWRSARVGRHARGMIEWICSQERWNPEVAIIFGAVARQSRATVGSSHDDARPDNSTLHTGAARPHTGFVESPFFISPRTGHASDGKMCERSHIYFVRVVSHLYEVV
jgi:hypothetical protein